MLKKQSEPLTVYFADLTHDTIGLATEVFPLNIGFIASYCKSIYNENIDVKLFKYPTVLEKAILHKPPDIIALSNYPWCHNLSLEMLKLTSKIKPECIRVMGGPNFPHDHPSQINFLKNRKIIDTYVYLEGEFGFANLISLVLDRGLISTRNYFKSNELPGCMHLSSTNDLLLTKDSGRIYDLSKIPSPYLTGLLDEFFDGRLNPMIQTNRGCPFRCSFCADGSSLVNKINHFDLSGIKEEIEYIAQRVPTNTRSLFISDLNFGMYKRDAEIADMISEIQTEYNYPTYIDCTTGKNSKKKIISAIEKLNSSLQMTMAVQSLDPNVLKNIKRSNISVNDYLELKPAMDRANLSSYGEVIVVLPGETYHSHIETLSNLLDLNLDSVVPHTLMMLNGSELNTPEQRKKYGIKTKFRIIPRDFTMLSSGRVGIEVEEVAISNNTFSYNDYVKARKVAYLISLVKNPGFNFILKFLSQYKIKPIDFILLLLERLESINDKNSNLDLNEFANLLNQFSEDTESELWNTEKEIIDYYQYPENFERLKLGLEGKNLIQSYISDAIAVKMKHIRNVIFDNARIIFHQKQVSEDDKHAFEELLIYCYGRTENLFGNDRKENKIVKSFSYDFEKWQKDLNNNKLNYFKLDTSYNIEFIITKKQFKEVEDVLKLFGNTPAGRAKTIIRIGPKTLWRTPIYKGQRIKIDDPVIRPSSVNTGP